MKLSDAIGTLAASWGEDRGFFASRVDGAWRLQVGRLSLQYVRVESSELVSAWADEVESCEELIEHRVGEVGVWN